VNRFWTRTTERAARLVAEDQQKDEAIAASLRVRRSTLDRWKRRPEFQARVAEHVQAFREALRGQGIAERQNRVAALNDRWAALKQVIAARAADPTMKGPGHETGLLVRTYKPTRTGRTIEEYAVDTGLLAELRAHEKQAAQELGQWSEGKADAVLKHLDLSRMSCEQLERLANGDDPLQVLLGS